MGVSFDGEGNPRGFLWRHGEMVDFNELLLPGSPLHVLWTTAINDGAEVAGFGATSSGDVHAFLAKPNVGATAHATVAGEHITLTPNIRELVRGRLPANVYGVRRLNQR